MNFNRFTHSCFSAVISIKGTEGAQSKRPLRDFVLMPSLRVLSASAALRQGCIALDIDAKHVVCELGVELTEGSRRGSSYNPACLIKLGYVARTDKRARLKPTDRASLMRAGGGE